MHKPTHYELREQASRQDTLLTFLDEFPGVVSSDLQSIDLEVDNGDEIVGLICSYATNKNCEIIDFSRCQITEEGAKSIAKALKEGKYPSLQHLDLSYNDLSGNAVEYIADALMSNESLKTLILTGNDLGDDNVQKLADALMSNESLEKLDLTNTNFGNDGVHALTEMLHVNKTLRSLDVANNEDVNNPYSMFFFEKALAEKGLDLSSPSYEVDLSAFVHLYFTA